MSDHELRDLVRSVKESPEDPVLWLRLSNVFERCSRTGLAIEAARSAASCAPADPLVRARLARLGVGRGPWPDAAGGPTGARASPTDGARTGKIDRVEPLVGARGAVIIGPDGTAWVRTGSALAELAPTGALRKMTDAWNPHVAPVVGPKGAIVAACRERGALVAKTGAAIRRPRARDRETPSSRQRRISLEDASVDATGERLWAAWEGVLRGLPLHADVKPATIELAASTELFGPPRPAFAPDGRLFFAESDRRGGVVRAFDPEQGELWRLKVRSTIPGAFFAVLTPDAQVLIVRAGDTVHAVEPANGEIRWTRRTHVANWWRPPTDGLPAPTVSATGTALVTTGWGLVGLDVATGSELFVRSDLATPIPVAVDASGVAHVAMPGRLVGVSREGKTVYEVSLPTSGRPPGPPSIGYRGTTWVTGDDAVLLVV